MPKIWDKLKEHLAPKKLPSEPVPIDPLAQHRVRETPKEFLTSYGEINFGQGDEVTVYGATPEAVGDIATSGAYVVKNTRHKPLPQGGPGSVFIPNGTKGNVRSVGQDTAMVIFPTMADEKNPEGKIFHMKKEDLQNTSKMFDPENKPGFTPGRRRWGAKDPRTLGPRTNTKKFKEQKLDLRSRGYDLEETARFVADRYDARHYGALQSKPNVYLIVPSTSGINRIPILFAQLLRRDFGGEIIRDPGTAMATIEAKFRGSFKSKIEHPSEFAINPDILDLEGGNVVLVDDALGTGETVIAFKKALNQLGVKDVTVAVLGASDTNLVSERDLTRLSQKLDSMLGVGYDVALERVRNSFSGSYKNWFNYAEKSLTSRKSAKRLWEYLLYSGGGTRVPSDPGTAQEVQRGDSSKETSDGPSLEQGQDDEVQDLATTESKPRTGCRSRPNQASLENQRVGASGTAPAIEVYKTSKSDLPFPLPNSTRITVATTTGPVKQPNLTRVKLPQPTVVTTTPHPMRLRSTGYQRYRAEHEGHKVKIDGEQFVEHGSYGSGKRQRRQTRWNVEVDSNFLGYAESLRDAKDLALTGCARSMPHKSASTIVTAAGLVDLKELSGRISMEVLSHLRRSKQDFQKSIHEIAGDEPILKASRADRFLRTVEIVSDDEASQALGEFDWEGRRLILHMGSLKGRPESARGKLQQVIEHELRHAADWAYQEAARGGKFEETNFPGGKEDLLKYQEATENPEARAVYTNTPTELKSLAGSVADALWRTLGEDVATLSGRQIVQWAKEFMPQTMASIKPENLPDFLRRVIKGLEQFQKAGLKLSASAATKPAQILSTRVAAKSRVCYEAANMSSRQGYFYRIAGRLEDVKRIWQKKYTDPSQFATQIEPKITQLSAADPSGQNKYLSWMAEQVLGQSKPQDDIVDLVKRFHTQQPRIRKDMRDLNKLDLFHAEWAVERAEADPTHQAKRKEVQEGSELIAQTSAWKLYEIKNKEASCTLGMGTKWCITQKDKNYYEDYTEKGAKFFFVIPSKGGEKFAVAATPSSGALEVYDAADDLVNPTELPSGVIDAVYKRLGYTEQQARSLEEQFIEASKEESGIAHHEQDDYLTKLLTNPHTETWAIDDALKYIEASDRSLSYNAMAMLASRPKLSPKMEEVLSRSIDEEVLRYVVRRTDIDPARLLRLVKKDPPLIYSAILNPGLDQVQLLQSVPVDYTFLAAGVARHLSEDSWKWLVANVDSTSRNADGRLLPAAAVPAVQSLLKSPDRPEWATEALFNLLGEISDGGAAPTEVRGHVPGHIARDWIKNKKDWSPLMTQSPDIHADEAVDMVIEESKMTPGGYLRKVGPLLEGLFLRPDLTKAQMDKLDQAGIDPSMFRRALEQAAKTTESRGVIDYILDSDLKGTLSRNPNLSESDVSKLWKYLSDLYDARSGKSMFPDAFVRVQKDKFSPAIVKNLFDKWPKTTLEEIPDLVPMSTLKAATGMPGGKVSASARKELWRRKGEGEIRAVSAMVPQFDPDDLEFHFDRSTGGMTAQGYVPVSIEMSNGEEIRSGAYIEIEDKQVSLHPFPEIDINWMSFDYEERDQSLLRSIDEKVFQATHEYLPAIQEALDKWIAENASTYVNYKGVPGSQLQVGQSRLDGKWYIGKPREDEDDNDTKLYGPFDTRGDALSKVREWEAVPTIDSEYLRNRVPEEWEKTSALNWDQYKAQWGRPLSAEQEIEEVKRLIRYWRSHDRDVWDLERILTRLEEQQEAQAPRQRSTTRVVQADVNLNTSTEIKWHDLTIVLEAKGGERREQGDNQYVPPSFRGMGYFEGLIDRGDPNRDEFDVILGSGGLDQPVYLAIKKEEDSFRQWKAFLGFDNIAQAEGAYRILFNGKTLGGLWEIPAKKFRKIVLPRITKEAKATRVDSTTRVAAIAKRAWKLIEVDPTRIEPPHPTKNQQKLMKLIESMKSEGWQGRPILAYMTGGQMQALTGSHRIAASREAGLTTLPVLLLEDLDFPSDEVYTSLDEATDNWGRLRALEALKKVNPATQDALSLLMEEMARKHDLKKLTRSSTRVRA